MIALWIVLGVVAVALIAVAVVMLVKKNKKSAPVEEKKETVQEVKKAEEPKKAAPAKKPATVKKPAAKKPAAKKAESAESAAPVFTNIPKTSVSFTAKLAMADKDVNQAYSDVKNHLLSYKCHSRVSWKCDSFNYGMDKVAKLNVRGKTLVMFIALDPKIYTETKYKGKDYSASKRYAETPYAVKIKSERGVKFAKELIDIYMTQKNIPMKKESNEDFKQAPRTRKALIKEGLIKVQE